MRQTKEPKQVRGWLLIVYTLVVAATHLGKLT